MNIHYKNIRNPFDGVSLIRSLGVPIPKAFNIDEITILPNMMPPVDSHEVAELWLILEGEGDLYHQGKTHSLKPGDWSFFMPYDEHQILNKGQGDLRILSIYWGKSQ